MANKVMQIGSCAISESRDNPQRNRVYDTDGLSPTISTMQGGGHRPCIVVGEDNVKEQNKSLFDGLRIRRLTPKECWRLMGFTDEEFTKAQNTGLSNTQLYKQAGNSIVVNVLVEIFRNLYSEDRPKAERQMDIFDYIGE